MIVVADSSPLILLSKIGELDILHGLYGEVVVPDAVWAEVVDRGVGRPGSREISEAEWIQKKSLEGIDRRFLRSLEIHLDRGEAEALVLATKLGADLVLIDDRPARQTAASLELRCKGTLGVLKAAKETGRIEAVAPLLDRLGTEGFWLATGLRDRVLESVGESDD